MSKNIPVSLQTGHRTKAELEERKKIEEQLKGSNDRIYEVPDWLCDLGKKEYV